MDKYAEQRCKEAQIGLRVSLHKYPLSAVRPEVEEWKRKLHNEKPEHASMIEQASYIFNWKIKSCNTRL